MIYAKETTTFPLLTEALRFVGVKEEYISILPEFLDTEKPRNLALLDSIQTEWYQGDYNSAQNFSKAIKREIAPKQDDELWKRWMLYTYQLAGSRCNQTGFTPYEQGVRYMTAALKERYGEEAEARYLALSMTSVCESRSISSLLYLRSNAESSPEVCLKAIAFTKSVRTQIWLLTHIFAAAPRPQKGLKTLFSKKDSTTEAALVLLKALYQDATCTSRFIDEFAFLVAWAAVISDEWHDILLKKYSNRRRYIGENALGSGFDPEPIFAQLDTMQSNTSEYLSLLCRTGLPSEDTRSYYHKWVLPNRDEHLRHIAKTDPDAFRKQINTEKEIVKLKRLCDIFAQEHPEEQLPDLHNIVQQMAIKQLCIENENFTAPITMYLTGVDSMTKLLETVPQLKRGILSYRVGVVDYVSAFGMDDFAERCICLSAILNFKDAYTEMNVPNWCFRDHYPETIDILNRHGVPVGYILDFLGANGSPDAALERLLPRVEELLTADTPVLCTNARIDAIKLLQMAGKYRELFAYAGDAGKTVRESVTQKLPAPGGDYDDEYRKLLTSKKMTVREVAVTVLEKTFPDSLRADVQAAFEKEKNEKLKARFAVLLGEAPPETPENVISGDLVTELTKGSKSRKVDFLFGQPFAPVRRADGEPAEEKMLKALAVAYAEQNPVGRSQNADAIAAMLNTTDLEIFAQECFRRWSDLGAPAKTKWVLYLTAVHGGLEAITGLQRYIKEWSENSRGAIAADAAKALALNGSSPALMAVDAMARKFKNKQVRSASAAALQSAADELGITREELADRIVPDLGFDENRCRIFDFGARQFKVFINPALELEIYEGEKKLKNLPKPGAKDDPEKAAQAVKDFKEMKKQMKAAVQTQQARLEYALLCDRKWTAEDWRALFVQKAVMHCFAIGLIWGIYEDDKLVQSFRYMEDGSFNTADEDEYELPENAEIGLVHPMELDEALRLQWIEQLQDYEIRQPFPQLTRAVYRVTDEEKNQTELLRFEGRELTGIALLGRMTKLGWDKGYPGDGGYLTEFTRCDIMKQHRNEKGVIVHEGFFLYLYFSGMDISGYNNTEDVTIEKVEFHRLNTPANQMLALGEIPPRYFSEIVYMLSNAL
ncbi:MAG: DUF4132 domain-containing protein [Oscillospiraceae bacterium]|nr:DUF4132 domain-containing protein [Oscillospiraceae bacterium]